MVSFQCESCGDTLKKGKLDAVRARARAVRLTRPQHLNRCAGPFSCIDCSTTFRNGEHKAQCVAFFGHDQR